MKRENRMPEPQDHKELLSAWMDGELASRDAATCLRSCKSDAALTNDWAIYHCIGDVLRSEGSACHSPRLTAAIVRRLDAEPHVLAPAHARTGTAYREASRWRTPAAVAASLAAIAVVAGVAIPEWTMQRQQLASRPVPASIERVVEIPAPAQPAIIPARLSSQYLAAHVQYSGGLAMQGVVNQVRSVAAESGK